MILLISFSEANNKIEPHISPKRPPTSTCPKQKQICILPYVCYIIINWQNAKRQNQDNSEINKQMSQQISRQKKGLYKRSGFGSTTSAL